MVTGVEQVWAHCPEPIMNLVYKFINAPLQMVRLYEHEGRWDVAAQYHDLSRRSGPSVPGGLPGAPESGGGSSGPESLARSLMRMGSSHAALSYLQREQQLQQAGGLGGLGWSSGLDAGSAAVAPGPASSLSCRQYGQQYGHVGPAGAGSDLLYELSWRLGQWGSDPVAPAGGNHIGAATAAASTPPSSSSFNACIFSALRALACCEPSGYSSALSAATACLSTDALGGLGASGGNGGDHLEVVSESASVAAPLAVRCRMVGMLCDAGRLKWGQTAASVGIDPKTTVGCVGIDPALLRSALLSDKTGRSIRSREEYELLDPLLALRCRCVKCVEEKV